MSSYLKEIISVFPNGTTSLPNGSTTMLNFIKDIQTGVYKQQVEAIRNLGPDDGALKTKMKSRLPAVTISGLVTSGPRKESFTPKEDGTVRFSHSGLIQIDIDPSGMNGISPGDLISLLGKDKHTLAAYMSPSGTGVKGIFVVQKCSNKKEHTDAFLTMEKYMHATYGVTVDPATKDYNRICYVSYDPNIRINSQATPIATEIPQQIINNLQIMAQMPRFGSSKFPVPPEGEGVNVWTFVAAKWCFDNGLTMDQAYDKIMSYQSVLRRGRVLDQDEVKRSIRRQFEEIPQENAKQKLQDMQQLASVQQNILTFMVPSDESNLLLTPEVNHETLATLFCIRHGDKIRYCQETETWLFWNGQKWILDEFEMRLYEAYDDTLKTFRKQALEAVTKGDLRYKNADRDTKPFFNPTSMVGVFKRFCKLSKIPISVTQLDSDIFLCGTRNGIIDLKAGALMEPDKSKYVIKSLACDYIPEATCPTWDYFIDFVCQSDKELARFFQQWAGYTLSGSVEEDAYIFLHGEGQNGKSTFVKIMATLMGDYSQKAPDSLFVAQKDKNNALELAKIAGARMVHATETPEGAKLDEKCIKDICSSDPITARFHYKNFFDFIPSHKLWMAGNHKLKISGTDKGIWRRTKLTPFNAKIDDSAKDTQFDKKLEAELPGILNWAIAGFKDWRQNGLIIPQVIKEAVIEYRYSEDDLGRFLDENVVFTTGESTNTKMVTQKELYSCFRYWAEQEGIKNTWSAKVFNKKISDRGIDQKRTNSNRYWIGMSLVN